MTPSNVSFIALSASPSSRILERPLEPRFISSKKVDGGA
jgi:hypothetical protein